MKYSVGFIGYGEAAYHISMGLAQEGLKSMAAFDVMQNDPVRGEKIRSRAAENGVTIVGSLEELCSDSDFVISLTSPAVCVDVARQALPLLSAGQVFCDLNSADPVDMTAVDQLPRPEGVKFVDVGVMGSVPANKHKVKMYMAGDGANEFAEFLSRWNGIPKVIDAPAGGASAIKLLKSVFSKGLPQLFIETYAPAAAYGVLDEVLALTRDTFKKCNIEEWCDESLFRTLIHAKRRSAEAAASAKTVERLGFDASMSHATHKKLVQLAEQNYKDRIGDAEPNLRETIAMIVRDMRSSN